MEAAGGGDDDVVVGASGLQGMEQDLLLKPVLLESSHMFALLVVGVVLTYAVVMKGIFGSLSLSRVAREYRSPTETVGARYRNAFKKREQLVYHVDWARSRGDMQEARGLRKQIWELDKEIDTMEEALGRKHKKKTKQGRDVKAV